MLKKMKEQIYVSSSKWRWCHRIAWKYWHRYTIGTLILLCLLCLLVVLAYSLLGLRRVAWWSSLSSWLGSSERTFPSDSLLVFVLWHLSALLIPMQACISFPNSSRTRQPESGGWYQVRGNALQKSTTNSAVHDCQFYRMSYGSSTHIWPTSTELCGCLYVQPRTWHVAVSHCKQWCLSF